MGVLNLFRKLFRPKHTQVVEEHKIKLALAMARFKQGADAVAAKADRLARRAGVSEEDLDLVTVPPLEEPESLDP